MLNALNPTIYLITFTGRSRDRTSHTSRPYYIRGRDDVKVISFTAFKHLHD
jgi:hypothetical protein